MLRRSLSEFVAMMLHARPIQGKLRRSRRRRNVTVATEALESRVMLSAVSWDGGGGDLNWTNPLNWSGDVLPGAADDVTISVAGDVTIVHAGNTQVNSLNSDESLHITSGSFTVFDASEIQGALTTNNNTTITASGASATFVVSGPTTLGLTNLFATGGGTLDLSNAVQYPGGGDGGNTLRADGAGSRLILSGITTLSGYGRHGQLVIDAQNGGQIDLSGLTTIPGGTTHITAFGTGSTVDVSNLETWNDINRQRSSFMSWGDGGTVRVDSLHTINSVGVHATTGDTLVLPALTHLGGLGDSTATVLADGAGSRIEFPVLTTMDGTDRHGSVNIFAQNGGQIVMPAATDIVNGTMNISAFDTGSEVDVSGLQTWTDPNRQRGSSLSWGDGGVVRVDSLHTVNSVSILSTTGDTLVLPALTHIGGIGDSSATILADGPASRLVFPVLATMDGPDRHGEVHVRARNGGTVEMANATAILNGTMQITAFDAGSSIDLSSLQTWTDNNRQRSSLISWGDGGTIAVDNLTSIHSVGISATNGNVLRFPSLDRIGGVGDSHAVIIADGVGSRIEFPVVTVADGPERHGDVIITALNGGVIDAPTINTIEHGSVKVSAFDANSLVNMPNLVAWHSNTRFRDSNLQYGRTGHVNLDSLEEMTNVSIYAQNGETIRLPELKTYNRSGDRSGNLNAVGVGSRLELPALTKIQGSVRHAIVRILADAGGIVELPSLTSITENPTQIQSRGIGSFVDLPALANWDVTGRIRNHSLIRASEDGVIHYGPHASIGSVWVESYTDGELNGGLLQLNTAVAAGSSVIRGDVLNVQGQVWPGGALVAPTVGVLTIDGNYENSATGTLLVEINGTDVGAEHDQLIVTGQTTLDGQLNVTGSYTPQAGDQFVIIRNDSSNPILGTFTGLPQGGLISNFMNSGLDAHINYTGGDGNDVVISVGVVNTAPDIAADAAAVEADEGGTVVNTGTFFDADGNAEVTLTANVGVVTKNDATGTWEWSLSVADGPAGPANVTITASDGQESSTASFTYAIENVPPAISLSGNATVNEGAPYTLNLGVVTDPGQDTITGYKIDWGDGTIETFSGSPENTTAVHTYLDGPATQTYGVTVTDEDGTFLAGTHSVSVLNVAPVVTVAGPSSVNEGSSHTYTFQATDVGTDTFQIESVGAGLHGGVSNLVFNSTTGFGSFEVDFPNGPAATQIAVQVRDSDGTVSNLATLDVTIENLAPTNPADVDDADNEAAEGAATGTLVGIIAESTDPGLLDTVSYQLLDSAGGRFSIDASSGVVSVADGSLLDFEQNASHTIVVEASDGEGGASTTAFTIHVVNVAPSVPVDNDSASNQVPENSAAGTLVGITAFSTDPGASDVVTYRLTDDAGGRFAIDASTGVVSVADGSLLDYEAATSHTVTIEASDGTDTTTATFDIQLINVVATIGGLVFADADGDAVFDGGTETAIDGVTIELLYENGGAFNLLATDSTSMGGVYAFVVDDELGTYRIRELQPTGVDDGQAVLGDADGDSVTGEAEDGTIISSNEMEVTLTGIDASDYDFVEVGQALGAGDTAGIGFWQNKHGQALISQGGPALVNWLATNFDNIFGNTFSDGVGGDNAAEVADFYKTEFFKKKIKGTSKVDAQFMAVAFATFFTSSNLSGGTIASNYGFNVTATGIGTNTVNVGSNGAAFGVDDGVNMSIMALLLATNSLTGADNDQDASENYSHVYDINGDGVLDSAEKALRAMANTVYTAINES